MFCWSRNEETFHGRHETIESAIAEALDDAMPEAEPGDVVTVWIGETRDYDAAGSIVGRADWLLERLGEDAYENIGEAAEDWLQDVSVAHEKELGDALAQAFATWLAAHPEYAPTFYHVDVVKEHKVAVPAEESA